MDNSLCFYLSHLAHTFNFWFCRPTYTGTYSSTHIIYCSWSNWIIRRII